MSSAQQDDHDLPHEGPIKTPKQLIWAVALSFIVPILAIILLVNYVTAQKKPAAGSDAFSERATAERLQKVGRVELKDLSDPASLKSGKDVYAAQCAACHAAGLANAPKFGDAAAWAPRIKTGYEALLTAALKGKGSMGAQGGGDFSDLEIGRAVVFMTNQAGGSLAEPSAPAAAAAVTTSAATPAPAHRLQRLRRSRRRPLLPRRSWQQPRRRPMRLLRSTPRSARPATSPAWPTHPSSATRQRGGHAWPVASMA